MLPYSSSGRRVLFQTGTGLILWRDACKLASCLRGSRYIPFQDNPFFPEGPLQRRKGLCFASARRSHERLAILLPVGIRFLAIGRPFVALESSGHQRVLRPEFIETRRQYRSPQALRFLAPEEGVLQGLRPCASACQWDRVSLRLPG
jgi:hypothetical protein